MNKYIDLDQKFKKTVRSKIILSALIGIGIFFACFATVQTFSHKSEWLYSTYGFGLVLWVIVVYNLKTVQLLLEKEWTGEIISIEKRHGYYTPYKIAARGAPMIPTVYLDMVVRDELANEIEITYNTAFINASYYRIGMPVVHKRGSKYLVDKYPKKDKIICPICANTLWENKCDRCQIMFNI